MLDVIQLIVNDEKIKELVEANIYPNWTDYLGDCIIYSFHTTLSDKITETIRLQFTIITTQMSKGLEIEDRIKELLLTFADQPLTTDILQVELNGGGILYDNDREKNHRILYFDVLKRSD